MTTLDSFLGGKVRLYQDPQGLRATSDAVLLAAAVQAHPAESILDVGVGNGAVSLCLSARVPDLALTGIDCQPDLLTRAEENARLNGATLTPVLADITQRPSPLHGRQFHHVVTNPPFYDEAHLRHHPQTATAYHQAVPIADWLAFCLRHIRAKGTLTLIHRPEALPEILSALNNRLGSIEIIPIQSKSATPAKRIIVRGRMNSRKPLILHPPLTMHTLSGHRTQTAERILRLGHPIA